MTIVTFHQLHKSFGSEIIFDDFNLQFHSGEKVGIIGANGSGKTTLFKLILDTERPDMGTVTKSRNLSIGYLPQEPIFDGEKTVLEEMHEGFAELLKQHHKIETISHKLGEYEGLELQQAMAEYDRLHHNFEINGGYEYERQIKITLAGVGIEPENYTTKTSALSGGQLSRLGLAKVLMKKTDVLLLDEPTNHLDIQATLWLENYLNSYPGAVLLISHDRYLLDKVVGKIVEIHHKKAKIWSGNYSNYLQTKETVVLQEQREYEKRREFVEKTRDFIARNKDKEGMRLTARGRKTRLDKLLKENPDYLEQGSESKTVNFHFSEPTVKSDLIIRADKVRKAYGSLVLFDNLTFDVTRKDRLGIIGPNGTGKSTLLKLALGQIKADSGQIRMGQSLKIGYLDQRAEVLNPIHTVLEECKTVRPDLNDEALRGRLGAFLFTGEDVFKKIANLSGGQQNRLMLCKLVLTEPDVLVLDEPTNHLDIASREMLESALSTYPGTIIAVSHDRYFLDCIANRLLVIGADSLGMRTMGQFEFVTPYPETGIFTTYEQKLKERQVHLNEQKSQTTRKKQKQSQNQPQKNKTPLEFKPFNKYTVEQIEEFITDYESKIEQIQDLFGQEEYYQNPAKMSDLQGQFATKKEELELLYQVWEYRNE